MSVDLWKDARFQATMMGVAMQQGREKQGISQSKLAYLLDPDDIYKNITVPNISRWENGESIPPAFVAVKIHEWLLQARPGWELRFPTPARHTDPETSHKNNPSTNTQVHWGLTEVLRMYDKGLADFELENLYRSRTDRAPKQYPEVTSQRLRTPRHELVEAGRVEDTGKTTLNQRDRACTVWRYVPYGS